MMTTTVGELLGGPGTQARLTSEVARLVRLSGAVVPSTEATGVLVELLEMPLGDLALRAWRAERDVRQACERTAVAPGGREVVHHFQHRVRSVQEPVVEISVNGVRQRVLTLELEVLLEVSGADVLVEAGQVRDVRPGAVSGRARLSGGGSVILETPVPNVGTGRPDSTVT